MVKLHLPLPLIIILRAGLGIFSSIRSFRLPVGAGNDVAVPVWGGNDVAVPIWAGNDVAVPVWGGNDVAEPVWGGNDVAEPVWGGNGAVEPVWAGNDVAESVENAPIAANRPAAPPPMTIISYTCEFSKIFVSLQSLSETIEDKASLA
ncbi:MAG: hypothetical protein ACI39U_06520 [Candidatus Cryptobacteroides sp.]